VSYLRRMSRLGDVCRRYVLDALIVLAALEAAVEVAVSRGSSQGPDIALWVGVPAIILVTTPLLARRRFPFMSPLSVWLVAAPLSFVDGRLIASTGAVLLVGMASMLLLGGLATTLEAAIGLAVATCGAAIVVYNDPEHVTGDYLFTPALFATAWMAGFALRGRAVRAEAAEARAARSERDRELAARIAVAEERARIARELHDIVAHAMSVMVLHVGAVRHQLPAEMVEAKSALEGVERTGRSALAEMRRLLGAMRHSGEDMELSPQPGLDRLGALLEDVTAAGLPVRLRVEGDPLALPRAIDLSAYRIIQEGLTNALKHAGASGAEVALRYSPRELEIEVRDNGHGAAVINGSGHGLVGVRERVKIYGGKMTTRSPIGGGFVLATTLPLGDERS
jgi:signal transduction histidine kinase